MKMLDHVKSKYTSKYIALMIVFLLLVNVSLGYLMMRQTKDAIITLMQTRMLDISNTAAAMIDGDVLKEVTPEDKGTEGYESVMQTLTYFQDNINLKYIYCIRDMGDGTFTFGLDPTVEDPGEFGSPIVYTDALYEASQGRASADDEHYEDAWGTFYSAYSPAYDSEGNVAGIIAVDFDAEWYDRQLNTLARTTIIVALLSLLVGAAIVITIITRGQRKLMAIKGQLDNLETTLLNEMGSLPESEAGMSDLPVNHGDELSIDSLEEQIQSMESELKTQIKQVHGHAYQDGLTGVKSKHAYLEAEKLMDERIDNGTQPETAIVICDINGLKRINDTQGHKAGDEYIRRSSSMVCDIFSHSPVYRIGGDEFVVILKGRDYENRKRLMFELHRQSSDHIGTDEAIVSGGMAEYIPGQDLTVKEIFERADEAMYEEKQLLKSLGAISREDGEERTEQDLNFEEFLASSIRKHILIADDVDTNREMLGDLLQEDYDILYASDGVEALQMLRDQRDEIALLILDLYMPKLSGQEVLAEMQVDEDLMSIPVIVLTVDQKAELECLRMGAMDFIPKPYPEIEIVKARIAKCIELSEDRDLIRYTQRDKLTGLLNIDYFISYMNLFDKQFKDASTDAVLCDVNQFHSVNEQYGRQFGDLVLRSIGIGMNRLARKTGGIGCRKGGDTFLLYCPHQENYEQLLKKFMDELYVEKETKNKVSIRFGVFTNANLETDVEERFVCAGIAADRIKDDPQKLFEFYK